jgi:hypothetical protein
MFVPSLAFADPATNSSQTGGALTEKSYDPDYNGGDITRPEGDFEARFENKRSGTSTRTDENSLLLRTDGGYQLNSVWKLGWLAELPVIQQRNKAPDPADSNQITGAGDLLFQAVLARDLSERWAIGFGARLVAPTGDTSLGGGKWLVMPGFGVRYSFLEFGADTYFVPKIRYAMSFAGDPTRRTISEPQIAPTFNIGLPDRWFLTLYPSYDIRINFGDPSSGQTGRLFVPFDMMIGRKLTDKLVMSLEGAVGLIRDYPVYKYKAEFRITREF